MRQLDTTLLQIVEVPNGALSGGLIITPEIQY
jgi:hypothetical protein